MVWRKLRGDVCDAVDGAVVVVAVVVLVSVMVLMLACHPWAYPPRGSLEFHPMCTHADERAGKGLRHESRSLPRHRDDARGTGCFVFVCLFLCRGLSFKAVFVFVCRGLISRPRPSLAWFLVGFN